MTTARIEHINLTVSDPQRTAALLQTLFDWRVRWEGASLNGGYTMHVGSDEHYLALYAPKGTTRQATNNYTRHGSMNHVGVTVGDLEAMEKRVRDAGFDPFNHADYEPGRRFYFHDHDGVEYEIVSYTGGA